MKIAQTTFVITLSIILILLGFLYHPSILNYSTDKFNNVSILSLSISEGGPLKFIGALLTIPLLYIATSLTIGVKNIGQAILLFIVTLMTGSVFWILRLSYLVGVTNNVKLPQNVQNTIAYRELKFDTYFWYGIILGGVFCFILFYIKHKQQKS